MTSISKTKSCYPLLANETASYLPITTVGLIGLIETMRVRFDLSLMPESDRQFTSLEDGREYEVLEVTVDPSASHPLLRTSFRIEADETPALFAAELFHVVDGSLPQTWAVEGEGGRMTFGPRRWQAWQGQHSFWEDFFSGLPDVEQPARAAYEAERGSPGERS
jgi:hypothetical protein